MSKHLVFSVIIPAFNSASYIGPCLSSVLANGQETGYEIIVVDDGSSDGTVETAKGMGARVIENTMGVRRTISALRNAGARSAGGEIFAFLDSDMLVPGDWLEKAKAFFSDGFMGGMGFTDRAPETAGWVGRTWGMRMYLKLDRPAEVGHLNGRDLFINKKVFDELGGFDEELVTNEDKDLTMRIKRAGYGLRSLPEDRLYHLGYEKGLLEFIRKEFWRQGSSLAAAKKYGSSLRALRHPLLCAWHLLCFFCVTAALLIQAPAVAGTFLAAWFFPAAIITFTRVAFHMAPFSFPPLYFFLTFLRWNVAGMALVSQLYSLAGKRQ